MAALVAFALGVAVVDLDEGTWEPSEADPPATVAEDVGLPLVLATGRSGSRIVALVDRRPPLLVSNDAGVTWAEAGGGLPAGVAIAISPRHPDDLVFATAERLFVSRDGGRFWAVLPFELTGITGVSVD
jgi:hypothetical protein